MCLKAIELSGAVFERQNVGDCIFSIKIDTIQFKQFDSLAHFLNKLFVCSTNVKV